MLEHFAADHPIETLIPDAQARRIAQQCVEVGLDGLGPSVAPRADIGTQEFDRRRLRQKPVTRVGVLAGADLQNNSVQPFFVGRSLDISADRGATAIEE